MVEHAHSHTNNTPRYTLAKGATFWFTGLSGAGKSTLSNAVKEKLDIMLADNNKCFILDGDVIRQGLNKDLKFSPEDRKENIRRISEVSKLFNLAGQVVFVAFISPYAEDRQFGKTIHSENNLPFYECYVSASLEVCEARDVKGLYKKAREGVIPNFTGVSAPYEAPEHPDINVRTGEQTLEESVDFVLQRMIDDGILIDHSKPHVADSLIEENLTEAEKNEFETLKSIDLEIEQVEYLQTIAQGWAYPLKNFMNELQLLEVL